MLEESVEGVPGLRVGSGYARRTMTGIAWLRSDGYERDADARTHCRFGGNGSNPDSYGLPEPGEGMA